MRVATPDTGAEALALLNDMPGATIVAGGTDLMVDVNAGRRTLDRLVDISRVTDLRRTELDREHIRLGSGVVYGEIERSLRQEVPALAAAARTVGSLQIRSRATIGGNLATASPAGDGIPPLVARDATVTLRTAANKRVVPIAEFFVGPRQTVLQPNELVWSIEIQRGQFIEHFAKLGQRSAMAISLASVAMVRDLEVGKFRIALGSVGPVVLRAVEAEAFGAHLVSSHESSGENRVSESELVEFGLLVKSAARPIDDKRRTAAYRADAVAVLARRLFLRCLQSSGASGNHARENK